MKKMIKDTIDLDELNGAVVTTWISKLLDLQKQYGVCATITTFADEIYHDKGSILEMSFNRLETDEEYLNRIEREEYLERIQKNKMGINKMEKRAEITTETKTTWKWMDCFTDHTDDGKWLLTSFEFRMLSGKHYSSELKTVNFVATMTPRGVEFTATKNHCEYNDLSVDEMLEFIKFYVEKEGGF